MPRGDGTGPAGMGSMRGRGIGRCAGYAEPGCVSAGCGRGREFRRMYHITGLPGWARQGAYPYDASNDNPGPMADAKEALQNQADFLEKQLKEVRERLKSCEKDEKQDQKSKKDGR